jgi:hypothetical protein
MYGGSVRSADVPLWSHTFLPPLPLIFEAFTLLPGKPFHDRLFRGEFGIWEIGTAACSLIAFLLGLKILIGGVSIPSRLTKVLLGILTLGCFYLFGEEISWGQHIFGWRAGGIWGEFNYQQETNLHNLKELSLTNQLPRLVITFFAIVGCVVYPLFFRKKHQAKLQPTDAGFWLWPTMACFVTALFVLLPPIPKKLGLPAMPEPGETEEFYMALLLAIYLGSIYLRKRALKAEL